MLSMSGEVSYQSMYSLGYADALEDIRKLIQDKYQTDGTKNPETYSFYAGWNCALDEIIQRSSAMKG